MFTIGGALHCAKAQGELKEEADNLYQRVRDLDVGKTDSLKILSHQIFAISKSEYPLGVLRAKLVGVMFAINKFKLDSANALLSECGQLIDSNDEFKNSMEEGMLNFYQAQVAFRRSQFDKADSLGHRALVIFDEHDDLLLMGSVYNMFGTIEKLRQNEFKALSVLLKAYQLKLESGAKPIKMRSELTQIGQSYRLMGQYEKAMEYFHKVRGILSAIASDHPVLAALYQDIGVTKTQMSENDSALYYFTLSKSLSEKTGNAMQTTITNAAIADLFSSIGRFEESNALVLPLIRTAGHSRFTPMAAAVRMTAAVNYYHLKKYDSAMVLAKQGFALTTDSDTKHAQFAQVISETFEAKGKKDSALHYLKIYTDAHSRGSSLANQRKLSTLYADIENLSNQKEIELLEKQKALDAVEKNFLIWGIAFATISFTLVIVALRLQQNNRKKAHEVEKMQLQQELNLKEKDLHTQALKMIYVNNGITELEANLKKMQPGTDGGQLKQLLSTIHINKGLEKEWDNFNKYFSSVHADFYDKINARYPNLSVAESRLAGLIRMNMTNSEIASILNIESNSVKVAKYRLKKKVGLTDEEDIHSFIHKL